MSEPETKHVLVVANETLAGEELLDAVRTGPRKDRSARS
jgi:hypothetical protein